jgi:hypothetical protein
MSYKKSSEDSGDHGLKKIYEKCEDNIYGNEICVYIYLDVSGRRKKNRYMIYFINETFGERMYIKKSINEDEFNRIMQFINNRGVYDAYKIIF